MRFYHPRPSACSRVLLLLLAGILALPPPARAAPSTPRFFHLTVADGLSHNIIRAIVQDSQGFLWFGTQDGLNRYDGYAFTVFRHRRSDPHSPTHNTVQALAVDGSGTLWVGTVGGLDRYDRDTGGFVHYPEVAESVTVIYPAPDGTLWVGTAGSGLFRYDPRGDRFLAVPEPLSDGHILALSQDGDGTLWVGTEYGGLWAVPPEGLPYGYRHDPSDPGSLPHDRVTAILRDRTGTLWVGTGAYNEPSLGGLAALDPATGRFTPYRQGLPHRHVTALAEDRTGTLWVGTEGGLAVLDRAAGGAATLRPYRHDPLDPYTLVNDRVYALYEDHTGILWVGTDGGVSRYVPEKNRFTLYRHNPLDPNSLGAERVGAVLKDRDGVLWVGLHAGGLDRIAPDGTVTHYRHDPADPHSLLHDHVTALYQDPTGAIWVGTGAGLDRLDPETGGFTHFVYDPDDPNSVGPGAVKVIYGDRAGALWIGTEEPGTLSRLDPKTGRFTVYRYDPDRPDGFPNTYGVRAILEDREGSLWLGTYNGLVRFDPRTGTFTPYRHDPEDPHSLSDDFVWSLYEDAEGTLWVGTHSGLNRLDNRETGRFTVYAVEDGLPNDSIAAILGDDAGYLWLATMGGGLVRFDPRTETFRTYDESDGLQSMHFIPGAAFRSADGELFFGGTGGLNRFRPADIRENPHAPPVVLTAFRVFDRVRDFGQDLTAVDEIRLSYRDNFFSFEFAALDYADPRKNQYAYILEGFDRDWVHAGTRRYAAYTNVPPGAYTFRVRASNNDGVWNEEELAVRVVITPPFWQTLGFRALVALVVLGIASAVTLARMRYVETLRRSEEQFRTLFEQSPVGVCEADLSRNLPRLVHANPAFLRLFGLTPASLFGTPLEDLLAPESRAALESLCRMPGAGEPVTLEVTALRADGAPFPARLSAAVGPGRAADRCILVVEDLTAEKALRSEEEAIAEERRRIAREIHDGLAQDLAAVRLQVRRWQALAESDPVRLKAELEEFHRFLGEEIREVRRAIFALRPVVLDAGFWVALPRFLAEFGEQHQLDVSLEVKGTTGDEPPALPAQLELALFRILHEALNNVAKHARARRVWVELDFSDGIALRVRDDGVGFDPAALPELARRGHLGLQQIRERVEALGGVLEVRSQPGQGTEIRVKI
ncbi:MAG: PAS domain S-box protein [Thermoflexales bacterium]|nr:PAS domain S-box protein [Thermoflexales bacterium]